MSETTEDLSGTVCKLFFQGPTFCAGRIKLPGSTREESFAGKIHVCLEQIVTLRGSWVVHARFGRQFDAKSLVTSRSIDATGLMAWLEAKGQGLGIGPAKAKRLLLHFADEFIPTLLADPAKIAEVANVPVENMEQLAKYYSDHEEENRVYFDLAAIGLTDYLCTIIYRKYKGGAVAAIRENPYRLADEVAGIGFAKADEIASQIGISQDDPARVRAAVLHAATVIQDRGSTCSTLDSLVDEAVGLLKFEAQEHVIHCVAKCVTDGELVKVEDGTRDLYALPLMAMVEKNIAEFLKTFNASRDWGIDIEAGIKKHGDFLDDDQKDAVRAALTKGVVIVTGPAGCLHADTEIYDPIDNTRMTVRERYEAGIAFHVWANDKNGSPLVALATPPVKYPKSPMVRLRFASGRSIQVTHAHRLWNGESYLPASVFCERLQESAPVLLPSISENDLLIQTQDALRLMRKAEDLSDRYSQYSSRCDEQPRLGEVVDRSSFPLQDDVRRRSHSVLPMGDLATGRTNSLPLLCDLHSSTGSTGHSEPHLATGSEFRIREEIGEYIADSSSIASQPPRPEYQWRKGEPLLVFARQRTDELGPSVCADSSIRGEVQDFSKRSLVLCRASRRFASASSRPDNQQTWHRCPSESPYNRGRLSKYTEMDELVQAEPIGEMPYYDFHVPIYENYWSEGFFHHNSGKSTVIGVIVKICYDFDNDRDIDVSLCAPTGKAARRMEEIINKPASTIHRLLKYIPPSEWTYNAECPLMSDIIICDEFSMVDSELAWRLMQAIRRKAALVIVGDHNQLPPVGAGAALRDAIAHKLVPVIDLHTVHRAAGDLRKNSAMVLTGKMMPTASRLNDKPTWVVDDRHTSDDSVLRILDQLFVKILPDLGYDPLMDVQFMSPRRKGVQLCSEVLSERFQVLHQKRLGRDVPPTPEKRRAILYEGDKVIQTRNNYNLNIMNGTLGIVIQSAPKLIVKFEIHDEPIEIPNDAKGDIDLAYWSTVHKNQGSQNKVAVFLCWGAHLGSWQSPMLHRNLVYTAMTRARECAFIIGDSRGVKGAMERTAEDKRLTLLPVYSRMKS